MVSGTVVLDEVELVDELLLVEVSVVELDVAVVVSVEEDSSVAYVVTTHAEIEVGNDFRGATTPVAAR